MHKLCGVRYLPTHQTVWGDCLSTSSYSRGLISEEITGSFKTYHFDYGESTVAITNINGNTIGYRYDSIGNLSVIVYPDGTEVTYEYDVTNNLVSVTDWEDRKTVYTYDENNRAVGVIKPDGSTTTTVYDNAGRVISSVERNARGVIITGFEYTYDILGRVSTEKRLDKNLEICYTYDRLSRVTLRTVTDLATCNSSQETFNYDSAGNILYSATNSDYSAYTYDRNNRLISYNGMNVTYDADGNMTSAYLDCTGELFRYDSTNRLIGTNTNAYTYNAENVRIRNLCGESETTYVYNTNAKLSSMLMKTTDGRVTKYVYGRGLIGEETNGVFKTYHFDYRGSTVAITDINGNITDRFEYDTYGKLTSRTGTSDIIFLYNGRDGVVTDTNGLIYMRARYYAPELRRFINADILAGDIASGITLNRYAYANANPVSLIDPKGLAADSGRSGNVVKQAALIPMANWCDGLLDGISNFFDRIFSFWGSVTDWMIDEFKRQTAAGNLDWLLKAGIGATSEDGTIYHISQDWWQSVHFVGYNYFYDLIFGIGVGATGGTIDKRKFAFEDKYGKEYVIWAWKGDYINLGAGAELGIYEESIIPGHFLSATDDSMPMTLKLEMKNSDGDYETLFFHTPEELQWWINGFDTSKNQKPVQADDLKVTVTVDFSENKQLFEGFSKDEDVIKGGWTFDGTKATLVW